MFIVDDDAAVRSALSLLVAACGWRPLACASAEEFLAAYARDDEPGCLLLDLQMPGRSGPELQELLRERGIALPTIVITAYPDHPMAERARRAGALAVLGKPFRDEELLATLREVLGEDERARL